MDNSEILTVFALLYRRIDADEYIQLASPGYWDDFLTAVNGRIPGTTASMPLPAYGELQGFAARHFTGGLPTSVMPVESLYRKWSGDKSCNTAFASASGLYASDSQQHLSYIYSELGLQLSDDCPLPIDHLSLTLELLAQLLQAAKADPGSSGKDHGNPPDTAACREFCNVFINDHLDWLPSFITALRGQQDTHGFYIEMTELLDSFIRAIEVEDQS
jgi:TorA maturation chaperone TorD